MIGSLPLFTPPRLLGSAHVQTVSSALCRRVDGVEYERERIETPDDDFLDLDWMPTPMGFDGSLSFRTGWRVIRIARTSVVWCGLLRGVGGTFVRGTSVDAAARLTGGSTRTTAARQRT